MTFADLINNIPSYIQVALQVIGAASTIAAVTPTPKDDIILLTIRKALDFAALNIGHAKNK